MLSSILGFFAGWKGYAAAMALGVLIGAFTTWRIMSWHEGAQQTAQTKETVRYLVGASKVSNDISVKFEGIKLDDQKRTDDLVGIVPVTITPAIDIAYPVPVSFVCLFNDAAHSPVSDTACEPDDRASGVALSDVARATIENDGLYDQVAGQLISLQDWIKQQQALSEKAQ